MDKIKTHQSFLDHIYTELKDHVTLREKRAEEAHRRAIDTYRSEVDQMLADIARRVGERLSFGELATCRQLEVRLESLQKATSAGMDQFAIRMTQMEQKQKDMSWMTDAAQTVRENDTLEMSKVLLLL